MDTVWDSGLKETPIQITYPQSILSTLMAIQDKCGDNEFSVLCKGSWDKENGFEITNDIYVPEQEVSSTSVDFKEDISTKRADGYNTVIHSHPFSEKNSSFSSSDDESINMHFPCSILIDQSGFATAVLNLKFEGCHIRIETEEFEPLLDDIQIDLSCIKEKPAKVYPGLRQTPKQGSCKDIECRSNYNGYCFSIAEECIWQDNADVKNKEEIEEKKTLKQNEKTQMFLNGYGDHVI